MFVAFLYSLSIKIPVLNLKKYEVCSLTNISLAIFCGTSANSAELDQMPQIAAYDQGLYCLLTECDKKIQPNTP